MSLDIHIKVKDREAVIHNIVAATDMSMNLMEVFKSYGFPVEGICGGMAMCASCQCYITSNHELASKKDEEEAMLSEAFYVKENSRLACQILITKQLEGLEVELAPDY